MVEWLEAHYVEIFAVIGFLYSAARIIVALTPTPKDDAYMDKIGAKLTKLAGLFGLDLKQGRTLK